MTYAKKPTRKEVITAMQRTKISKKLKERKGGSTLLEILISLGLITFVLFYPVAMYSLTHKENLLEDVLATSLQMASVEGGLTDRVEDVIFLNLEAKKLIPEGTHNDSETRSRIQIISNADARRGAVQNLVYRDDKDPKIYIEIWYPAEKEIKLINGLSKLLGATELSLPFSTKDNDGTTWYYRPKGYVLSEKIDY